VETWARPLAWLIVALAPLLALAAGLYATRWAQWLVRTGGALGIAGLLVTGGAAVNLLVPRTCASSAEGRTIQRPLLSATTGEGNCLRTAWGQLQLVALAGVGVSAVVQFRRERRDGAVPALDAPGP
jgi:hypothetical protein